MNTAVLDAGTLGDDVSFDMLRRFGSVTLYDKTPPSLMKQRLCGVECAVVNKVKMNADTLAGADSLRLICIAATGYDNVDLDYCKSRNIAVCNVIGYSTDSVAQVTLATVLSLSTHLPQFAGYVASGAYSDSGVANKVTPVYHELAGKTWGIVGLGNIGRRVAAAAQALGCRVIAVKRTPDKDFECTDIDTLCKTARIITVHTPLSPETAGLISRERIDSMQQGTIFVNAARGAVCDEAALAQAAKEGRIYLGADVYTEEPFGKNHPYSQLSGLDNVCLTPHMAWGAYEARMRCLNDIAMSMEAFLKNEKRNRLV